MLTTSPGSPAYNDGPAVARLPRNAASSATRQDQGHHPQRRPPALELVEAYGGGGDAWPPTSAVGAASVRKPDLGSGARPFPLSRQHRTSKALSAEPQGRGWMFVARPRPMP